MLVTIVPGAGKTSVSRLLAQRFPLAAHIEADEIQNLDPDDARRVGARHHRAELDELSAAH